MLLADFFADHGCKYFEFISWWKGWLTVRAESMPAAQALLQHWLRLACTWPGAGRNWRDREQPLAELAPPPPNHKIPPSRELEMAERLRRLDDVLFFSAVELEDPRFTRAMAEIESNWPEPVHDLARFLPPGRFLPPRPLSDSYRARDRRLMDAITARIRGKGWSFKPAG